jgi:hypothetical protein
VLNIQSNPSPEERATTIPAIGPTSRAVPRDRKMAVVTMTVLNAVDM